MTDFVHVWSPDNLSGDWMLAPPSLESDADLKTAVIISLFSDRLAAADDVIPDATGATPPDRRGWWADNDSDGPIGSRLWLLTREKRTEATRQRAEFYAEEALQWLIADGVAQRIDVSAEWNIQAMDRLDLVITIYRNDGRVVDQRYDWAWQQIGAQNAV